MNSSILIIDDSPALHRLVEVWLRPLNVELHHAMSVEEGLKAARTVGPGLILLDMCLGDGSGSDVCTALKADPLTSSVPIIFLSAETRVEEKARALDLGAADYIVKPFQPVEFQARVRAALRMKYMIDSLADRARVDGLTGLHNRAYFDDCLEPMLVHARRHGEPLGCIMLDIDHFKHVNDTFGHPVGDEVLRHVASTLSQRCRRDDIICRYGGEEFVILTPQVGIVGAIALAEDIRVLVAGIEVRAGTEVIKVTCSLGVAEIQEGATASLPERADEALYFAKASGRNRVCTEMRYRGRTRAAS